MAQIKDMGKAAVPAAWADSDNGSEFINQHLAEYLIKLRSISSCVASKNSELFLASRTGLNYLCASDAGLCRESAVKISRCRAAVKAGIPPFLP